MRARAGAELDADGQVLLSLALQIAQACTYYRFHDLQTIGGYTIRFHYGYRDFWYISANMAEKCGDGSFSLCFRGSSKAQFHERGCRFYRDDSILKK